MKASEPVEPEPEEEEEEEEEEKVCFNGILIDVNFMMIF